MGGNLQMRKFNALNFKGTKQYVSSFAVWVSKQAFNFVLRTDIDREINDAKLLL